LRQHPIFKMVILALFFVTLCKYGDDGVSLKARRTDAPLREIDTEFSGIECNRTAEIF